MWYIPVLDLKDNLVVHAVRGERAAYRPLHSVLTNSVEPVGVLHDLLHWYPFRHVYIADLNALQGGAGHDSQIVALAAQYTEIEFWIDAGLTASAALPAYANTPNVRLIVASEALSSLAHYQAVIAKLGPERYQILSLDYRRGARLGAAQLMDEPALWPPYVIAMNLDRVGSFDGPDFDLLATLKQQAPACTFVAAGGVRDSRDLDALRQQQIGAVLLASALHQGRISSAELHSLAR